MKKKIYIILLLFLFIAPLNSFSYENKMMLYQQPNSIVQQLNLPNGIDNLQYTPPHYSFTKPDFDIIKPHIPIDNLSLYVEKIITDNNSSNNNSPIMSNTHIIWDNLDIGGPELYVRNLYDQSNTNTLYASAFFTGYSLFNDNIIYSIINPDNSTSVYKGQADNISSVKGIMASYDCKIYYPWYSYHDVIFTCVNNSGIALLRLADIDAMQDIDIATGIIPQQIVSYKYKTVWIKRDNSSDDYEIMYYDGDNITQITNNSYNDLNPFIHKDIIAWQSYDGHDFEIMYWNGSTIIQITNNDVDDVKPTVYNGTIAWSQKTDSDYEIMYWDGSKTHRITYNNDNDTKPFLYNGAIVWESHKASKNTDIIYSAVDIPWLPLPNDFNIFPPYPASYSPVVKNLPKYCKPIGVGDVSNNKLYLKVRTPKFEEAVDIYFAIRIPEFSNEYFLLKEGGGIQPASQGIVKWKTNVTNAINETIYNGTLTGFPKGHYNFYLVVVPKGSELLISPAPPYYFWQTSFELN